MRSLVVVLSILIGLVPGFAQAQEVSSVAAPQRNSWTQDSRVFTDPEQSKVKELVDSLMREDHGSPEDSGQIDQSSQSDSQADN